MHYSCFNAGSCLILLQKVQFTDLTRNTSVTLKSLFRALIPNVSKHYYEPVRSKHIIYVDNTAVRPHYLAVRKGWEGAAVQFGAEIGV